LVPPTRWPVVDIWKPGLLRTRGVATIAQRSIDGQDNSVIEIYCKKRGD
jgi:hypothetical protein